MTSASEAGAAGGEAATAMARMDAIAACTDEPGRITRLCFSPALKLASTRLVGWMQAAGMSAGFDAAGNVVGRYEGERSGAPALMIGSHLDSVRDGGRFDGPLGVVAALAVVERLRSSGRRLPHALEIVGFADEEGVRFGGSVLGSAAMAGQVPAGWRDRLDGDGLCAGAAVRAFGVDPDRVDAASRRDDPPFAYLELHIEQGPALEAVGRPLGCVSGIAGAVRQRFEIAGTAGHAGTVPMAMRRDALAAAAECILAVERIAAGTASVATVGMIEAMPNASNVIAGRAVFTLDLRAADDALRHCLHARIGAAFGDIIARRGLSMTAEVTSETRSTPCSQMLRRAIGDVLGPDAPMLPSGAGHDGINMAAIAPIGMIFVRCLGGVSHNPAESVSMADLQAGIDALHDICLRLSAGEKRG